MRTALAALFGTASLFAAVAALLFAPGVGSTSGSALVFTAVVVVGIVGFVGALVKISGSGPDGDGVVAAPWRDAGAIVDRAPERTPADHDLSGERLAGVVEEASATARDDGTVAAGVAVVRPHLREVLLDVLVRGGTDRVAAERLLASGEWTDDATAAAALDGAVDHPGWSPFERFEAWLFPEQAVRREVGLAMGAIARVAEDELPTVPGQRAPRTVPVRRPTLEDLRRGADGHLQRAVDPLGAMTGSEVEGTRRVDDATAVGDESDPAVADGDERPPSTDSRETARRPTGDLPVGGRSGTRESDTREEEGVAR